MAAPPLIGVGASAGGVEALLEMVSGLGADLPVAMLVVLHQPAAAPTVLSDILARHCAMEVVPARAGDVLRRGRVHVSSPDRHLQVANGRILTTRGPPENGHRPSVDPLFRSLAHDGGPRATGVVLSGMLDDGAAGLLEIVRHGGSAIVQDPRDALHDGMPRAALARVPGAVVRPAHAIGAALGVIATRVPAGEHHPSSQVPPASAAGRGASGAIARREPSGLSACPDCDAPPSRAGVGRCRSPRSPGAARDDRTERALYSALRALEDKAASALRVAEVARRSGAATVVTAAHADLRGALADAAVLRRLLGGGNGAADTGHPLPEATVGRADVDEGTGECADGTGG